MRKKVLLILLCIASVFAATGRDRLYIENFNIQAGKTVQVPVILLNDTVYSGLQTDLYLPAGLSLDMEDNEYIIDLTSRTGNNHTVASNKLSNGAIRIYVSSANGQEFSGNSGTIMTLCITAASNFSGRAIIELKNSLCAEAIGTRHELNDETCTVNPGAGVTGDVNHDGEVNITDVNVIIKLILSGLYSHTGDINQDGEVNITDVNAVIKIILNN